MVSPTERRQQILLFAVTYGVVKAEWIYHAHYAGLSMESVVKDLQVLCKRNFLRRHGPYYVPTERTCVHHGINRKYGQTRGELTIARRVAVAAYCVRYGLAHCSAPQFRKAFPLLATVGHCGNYYADGDVFGWVEPDCNINGDTRNLVEKCRNIFRVRARNPHWKKVIDAGNFHITVVTPSLGKQLVLKARFTERKFFGPVYVEVVEELQQLLIGSPESWQSKNSHSPSTARCPSANGPSGNGSGDAPR